MENQRSPADFNRIFVAGFAAFAFTIVMIFLAACVFLKAADGGAKYADMIVPFLLATAIGGIFGFFYSVNKPKDPESPAVVAATAPANLSLTNTGPASSTASVTAATPPAP